jgi:hypothetical protein
MALPLTEYQQLILYDKLVIARGNYKINLFWCTSSCKRNVVMIFFVSFSNITLIIRNPKGSHIKWWHVLRSYINILKIDTRPKSIGKCCNMIFYFLNLMIFFSIKKAIKYSFFIYIFHICEKISNQKENFLWHVYLNVFNHIVTFQQITWIFVYDRCHFWRK